RRASCRCPLPQLDTISTICCKSLLNPRFGGIECGIHFANMAARTAVSSSRSRRRATDWKDIDQTVKPRAMSSVAERKIWMRRARIAALGLAGARVVAAALRFMSFIGHAPALLTRAGEALPIETVSVE